MTLARTDFLIRKIRRSTNRIDSNRITDQDIVDLLNRAQREMQRIILSNNTDSPFFKKEQSYDIVSGIREFSLPADMFNSSALEYVKISGEGDNYAHVRKITPQDESTNHGYFLLGSKLYLEPIPRVNSVNGLVLGYTYKLPEIAIRYGKITALTSGASITIERVSGALPFIEDEDPSLIDDYCTLVGADGTIKDSSIIIDSFDRVTGVITTSSTISNAAVGDFLVPGKYSTTHAAVPDACEDYLVSFTERKIYQQDSSADITNQHLFTEQEREDLIDIFTNSSKDAMYPPIVDTTYCTY